MHLPSTGFSLRNGSQVSTSCCYWPVGIDLTTFTIIIQIICFSWFGCGVYWRERGVCLKSNYFLSAGIPRILKRQLSGRALKYKHFELKTIVITKSKFPKLLWAGLFLRSVLVFLRVWNVLINIVMIKGSYFFIPGFWCCCLYLLFVGVSFIFHLRSEPREERLSTLGKLNLGPKSYCRCSMSVSPYGRYPKVFFLDTSNEADHRKNWVTLPPNRPGRTFLNSFPVFCALFIEYISCSHCFKDCVGLDNYSSLRQRCQIISVIFSHLFKGCDGVDNYSSLRQRCQIISVIFSLLGR